MIIRAALTLAAALIAVLGASTPSDLNGDGLPGPVSGNVFNPAASLNLERMADRPAPVIWVSGHIGAEVMSRIS